MEYEFEHFKQYMDFEIEKVQDKIAKRFEKIVQKQLDAWGKRFHNHTFTATEGNGSLSFEMNPPLKGSLKNSLGKYLDYIPPHLCRGAIKEMLDEAEALTDLYNEEFRVSPGFHSDFTIKSK